MTIWLNSCLKTTQQHEKPYADAVWFPIESSYIVKTSQ